MTTSANPGAELALLERIRPLAAAREKLADFITFCRADYEIPPHIRAITEALEAAERGELPRVAITMPPRHGKTEQAVRMFVPWFLGRNPDRRVIVSTYGQELSDDHGRDVRRLMQSPAYRTLFEIGLDPSTTARDAFDLAGRRGGARFVGRGGAIVGRGAHLLVLDDLLKNREEADSPTVREAVWDFYSAVLRTRLEPGGVIVVIGTRWHSDDYLARLVEREGAERFHLLHFPALDSEGAALWPSRFGAEDLGAIRSTLGAREWSALYMGSPQLDTGSYFQRGWFKYHDRNPERLTVFAAADFAYGTSDAADYSAIGIFGVDEAGKLYVLDWHRRRGVIADTAAALARLVAKWNPNAVWVEGDPGTRAVLDYFKRVLADAGCYRPMKDVSAAGDKPQKARSIQALFDRGLVSFPYGAAWLAELEAELLVFDAGKHDDQVDALSVAGRAYPRYSRPARPVRKVVTETRTVPAPGGGVTEIQVEVGGTGSLYEYELPDGRLVKLDYKLRPLERGEGYGS